MKYTALPFILALAIGGCATEPKNYPNFKACYAETDDANDCIQYIPDTPYIEPNQATGSFQDSSGIDGSSALTGAAVGATAGAVAGYALANNSKRRRTNNSAVVVPPPIRSNTSQRNNSNTSSGNKPNLTKNSPSKSSTSRGGFGSTAKGSSFGS